MSKLIAVSEYIRNLFFITKYSKNYNVCLLIKVANRRLRSAQRLAVSLNALLKALSLLNLNVK